MNFTKYINVLFIALLLVTACKKEKKNEYTTLDLLSYGVPLKVKAPPGTEVKVKDIGIAKDITLKKGDDFFIQILNSSAITGDINKLKQQNLEEVKKSPYFSKVILDEDNGFVYEKKMNDSLYNYDFRYIKLQGDQQYIFQTGLFGLFTKDQVMNMYNAIK